MDLSPSGVAAVALRNRRLVRAPITLYQKGFGWIFGSRMLMLEHVGRSSRQPRFVVLEVAERPAPDRLIVASGFGPSSQWYQNLAAQPHCHISTGRLRRRPAHARLLDTQESATALARYKAANPRGWRVLHDAIEKDGAQDPETIPLVEFQLA
ncbi:nitroreductase family deazaflavin-dependent oxidoreductase [Gordonia sp. ABSL1-1]|uniref:nitroreductase family deazaflavin-dependent oxidoreductase n=1 Tax=Gordonia sp. ABSL1-1 TaxID=3053923 RepID=UPI002574030A|nr:nitroreductase family deazaflavin-dependent oxidoreductase [Gordonia sp. ABSL1-1]MDL9938754.1 nitroreductase family deazaflavin-dependent oxidoreductase [Gordonia sp. ABSL1-1]